MKVRIRAWAAVAVATLAWAACTSFSGEATPGASDGGDGEVKEAATDAPIDKPDVGIADGGGAQFDAHVAVAGALIDESFERSGSSCGWPVGASVTAFPVAGGHTGARSCLVCSAAVGGAISRTLSVAGAGTFQLVVSARAPTQDAATGLGLTVYAYSGGSLIAFGNGGQVVNTAAWVTAQVVVIADAGTDSVVVYLHTNTTDGCLLVDDVLLTRE